jgi:hypothetical protein
MMKKEMKIEIRITGDCICGCGRQGSTFIPVNDDLRENAGKYMHAIKKAEQDLYCDECFMLKLTGLNPETVQNIIVSSSSED